MLSAFAWFPGFFALECKHNNIHSNDFHAGVLRFSVMCPDNRESVSEGYHFFSLRDRQKVLIHGVISVTG
jgi:hypothetical protein